MIRLKTILHLWENLSKTVVIYHHLPYNPYEFFNFKGIGPTSICSRVTGLNIRAMMWFSVATQANILVTFEFMIPTIFFGNSYGFYRFLVIWFRRQLGSVPNFFLNYIAFTVTLQNGSSLVW